MHLLQLPVIHKKTTQQARFFADQLEGGFPRGCEQETVFLGGECHGEPVILGIEQMRGGERTWGDDVFDHDLIARPIDDVHTELPL